jgi:hypothetical protein
VLFYSKVGKIESIRVVACCRRRRVINERKGEHEGVRLENNN